MNTEKLVFGSAASIAVRDRSRDNVGIWRLTARAIIIDVIQRKRGKPLEEIREAVSKAYPWGMRANHPHQMWLKEAKVQLAAYIAEME